MKGLQWISRNRDRAGIKANEPELWERLEKDEVMETQQGMK
ncbi:MAG: hypothetical protein QNK82_01920 [Akkermansiaceae bacterium]|jgi:hypothetical protein